MHQLNLYDYSARQMEAVIGRFTSVDPMAEKYYSWSPYVYCANNPMKYIDPTGMWIMLTDSTNNVNYRYDNGKLYREQMNFKTKQMEYVAYTPDAGSFFEGVLNALNDLGKNSATGQALIDYFSNDQNNIGIATDAAADRDDGNHIKLGQQGYPTIFMKSNLQGSNIPTQAGMQQSPFWLDLGHELAHGHDRSVRGTGAATTSQDGLVTSSGDILPRTEIYATFRENAMRGEAGLPLRTHYYSTISGTRGVGPALINSSGRSTFLGTPYLPANTLPPPKKDNMKKYFTMLLIGLSCLATYLIAQDRKGLEQIREMNDNIQRKKQIKEYFLNKTSADYFFYESRAKILDELKLSDFNQDSLIFVETYSIETPGYTCTFYKSGDSTYFSVHIDRSENPQIEYRKQVSLRDSYIINKIKEGKIAEVLEKGRKAKIYPVFYIYITIASKKGNSYDIKSYSTQYFHLYKTDTTK